MTDEPPPENRAVDEEASQGRDLEISDSREARVGSLTVHRALPRPGRRTVGALSLIHICEATMVISSRTLRYCTNVPVCSMPPTSPALTASPGERPKTVTVPLSGRDSPRTVSYTHLDVYKRQTEADDRAL